MLRPDPVWLVVLLCVGCVTGTMEMRNYGDMRPSAVVKAAFEGYVVDGVLEYYVSGPEAAPTGLMGIERSHTLESELWSHIDDPAQAMKGLVRAMQSMAAEYGLSLYGFDIRDDRGNDIGDWYSTLEGRMPVKIGGERSVSVYPPPNDIYERIKMRHFTVEDD